MGRRKQTPRYEVGDILKHVEVISNAGHWNSCWHYEVKCCLCGDVTTRTQEALHVVTGKYGCRACVRKPETKQEEVEVPNFATLKW